MYSAGQSGKGKMVETTFAYPEKHREELPVCTDPLIQKGNEYHAHIQVPDERDFSSFGWGDIAELANNQGVAPPPHSVTRTLLKDKPGVMCIKT